MCDNAMESIFIVDVYNGDLWPRDSKAEEAINIKRKLHCGTTDSFYMLNVNRALEEFEQKYIQKTDVIFFNAGSDILSMDPLGRMDITPECLIKRDKAVFQMA